MTPAELHAHVLAEIDEPYLLSTAAAIAEALHDGTPIEVAFQPGDGTRYDLVIVPVQALIAAPGRVVVRDGQPEQWGAECALGISREPGKALVAWARHGAVGLDLSCGGFVASYIDEIFADSTMGSSMVLEILFDAVAEAFQRG